jgi:hypothetical protein
VMHIASPPTPMDALTTSLTSGSWRDAAWVTCPPYPLC